MKMGERTDMVLFWRARTLGRGEAEGRSLHLAKQRSGSKRMTKMMTGTLMRMIWWPPQPAWTAAMGEVQQIPSGTAAALTAGEEVLQST